MFKKILIAFLITQIFNAANIYADQFQECMDKCSKDPANNNDSQKIQVCWRNNCKK